MVATGGKIAEALPGGRIGGPENGFGHVRLVSNVVVELDNDVNDAWDLFAKLLSSMTTPECKSRA